MSVDDSVAPEERERVVARRLRVSVAVLLVLGAAAAVLGYLPEGIRITDMHYRDHLGPAGGSRLAASLLLLVLPSIAVLWRPRWLQIVVWMIWALPSTALALAMIGSAADAYPHNELVWPMWPGWSAYMLVGAISFGIVAVIPAMRSTHRSPPLLRSSALPSARVHRG